MSEPPNIVFVVDDDASMRDALNSLIRSVGLRAELFGSPREFLQAKRPDAPSCLVLDVRLPGESGLDLQRELAAANINIPIIFITGHGDIPMSVKAMKAGAVEFLTKPFRDRICWMPFKWRWRETAPGNNAKPRSQCSGSVSNY